MNYKTITTFVVKYNTLLENSRELRKLIFVLKLFVITIVLKFYPLSDKVSLCFQYVIYC